MNLALYAPFKPLDHPRLSGDVAIPRDLKEFLEKRGHTVQTPSRLSSEWIWRSRLKQAWLPAARRLAARRARNADAWLTYHSYYRSPDVLGPWCARRLRLPYVIWAGSYATKRQRDPDTRPGFDLNLAALQAADLHIANKQSDRDNLLRLVPQEKVSYIPLGVRTERYSPDPAARKARRSEWNFADGAPVAVCAAMLRPGVKVQGVEWTIRGCAEAAKQGAPVNLVLAGDGSARDLLEGLARELLAERVRFLGFVPPADMPAVYAAGDFLVFPGIREGLGLAYLEAQCAGLPCVAFDHDGAPEVIRDGETGFVTPSFDMDSFAAAVARLAADAELRAAMGQAAREHVLARHDLQKNYTAMENAIAECAALWRTA